VSAVDPAPRFVATRRAALRVLGLLAGTAAGLAAPLRALALERNVRAFESKTLDDALAASGTAGAQDSDAIEIKAPDIAENSAIVHVEIRSRLPDTRTILLFAEKNPQPLVAQFDLLPGLEPYVAVRIKMAESAFLRVVVKAGEGLYVARRETKVTLGGCAG
jgi:sulfur-oxidizing protein SoxY